MAGTVGGRRTRRPAVAGVFYPAAPEELAATVDGLLSAARASAPLTAAAADEPAEPIRALVVPHAGYVYSAAVAASAYAQLQAQDVAPPRRVVLLGPSHHVPLDGMACAAAGRWLTPLGEVEVEQAPGIRADDRPHADDHALEVQLPFLQRIASPLTRRRLVIVPVAVGRTAAADVSDRLDALEAAGPTLVVVSTDLSHYRDAATAARLDRRTAEAILSRDADAIRPEDACGAWALRGLLEHSRRRDRSIRLLDLRTSADTAGGPERVVGYGAFTVSGLR